MYKGVDKYIQGILEEIRGAISRKSHNELLEIYIREWNHYFKAAKSVSRMLGYLDADWTRRQFQGKKNVHLIRDLLLLRWNECIVNEILPLILELVHRQQNGESINITQVKAVLDSFQAIGIEQNNSKLKVFLDESTSKDTSQPKTSTVPTQVQPELVNLITR